MSTEAVAKQLVDLCRAGKNQEAIETLYSPDIVSVEATPMPDGSREMKGMAAVVGKAQWWQANHEVHGATTEGPLVSGSNFCVRFKYDVTNKPSGKRLTLDELAVYHVKDGKIDREEFIYGA